MLQTKKIQSLALAALWADQPDIADKLTKTGESLMGCTVDSIEGVLWVVLSTPALGQVGAYLVDDLVDRFEHD